MRGMLYKKLAGFSLAEVLFNMILITIVISCGYLGYEYAFSDMNLFDKANNKMQDYVQFTNALTMDKEKCTQILNSDNEITFMSDKKEQNVLYKFMEDKVIRNKDASADTFHIEVRDHKNFYEQNEITDGLTDRIEIRAECSGKQLYFQVTKNYDAYTKMSLTEKNGN
jgi:hypothetical protein